MNLELAWELGTAIFSGGILYAGIRQWKKDMNGIGARVKSEERERIKGQFERLVQEDDREERRWMVNLWLGK